VLHLRVIKITKIDAQESSSFCQECAQLLGFCWKTIILRMRSKKYGSRRSDPNMSKYPSEIFGHPFSSPNPNANQDRRNHWCPFVNRICYKQSRLISYPFGVCSVHIADHDIAVCPRRFLDGNRVFRDIAQHHFKTTDNILVFRSPPKVLVRLISLW
jgi:hypothetical protein